MDLLPRTHIRKPRAEPIYIGAALALVVIGVLVAPFIRDQFSQYTDPRAQSYALLSRGELIDRVIRAEDAATNTKYQSILYKTLNEEFTKLKSQYEHRLATSYTAARVTARPPKTVYDTLTIAAGKNDGVFVGDIAGAYGTAIGTVTSVSDESSVVTLYSAPNSKIHVLVGTKKIPSILVGEGGGSFNTEIPEQFSTAVGDIMIDEETRLPLAIITSQTAISSNESRRVTARLITSFNDLYVVDLTHELK